MPSTLNRGAENGAADRLVAAMRGAGSALCVGLDPVLDRLPPDVRAAHPEPVRAIEAFCRAVLKACRAAAGVVKPQSACFERYGASGVACLEHVCHEARELGYAVILDAKRGDIGVSAEHYAASATRMRADFITVNAYLGPSTVAPYLDAGLGVFVLVRTSNPDSDVVQGLRLADGRTVAEMMAEHVAEMGRQRIGASGYSAVGAVVGATKSAESAAMRARMPNALFLVPGFGAQGGTIDDVRVLRDSKGAGVVVNASRSVIYPSESGSNWAAAVERAAAATAGEMK